jgi:glucose/arabinose dehydrogenase
MITLLSSLLVVGTSLAQNTCSGTFSETDPSIAAKGFTAYVVAKNLTNPRGIVFDKNGNLLVIEKFRGVTALKLQDEGNCVRVESRTRVISDGTVSGIVLRSW